MNWLLCAAVALAALVGGHTDEKTFWLGGAYLWKEVPEGEQNEQIKAKFVLARVADGQFSELAASPAGVFLGAGVERLKVKLELRGDRLRLLKYQGGDWVEALSAESGASSFGDGYRVGVYADRPGETLPAAFRFDNFSASWWLPGSGNTDVTDYTYDPAKPYLLTRISTNGGADKTC